MNDAGALQEERCRYHRCPKPSDAHPKALMDTYQCW